MNEQFVTYEIALELKELGFDNKCFGYYSFYDNQPRLHFNNITSFDTSRSIYKNSDSLKEKDFNYESIAITAPLWQQVTDWFRNKHNIFVCPIFDHIKGKGYWVTFGEIGKTCNSEWNFDTYEQAREYVILEGIKIIKSV